MTYDPSRHHRRSIRLKGYDYSRPGAYFITIVAQDRACLFGKVVDGVMHLSEVGQIVAESWQWLAAQYDYVTLDAWVVMPNHIHGIIVITDQGGDDGGRGGDNGGGGGNNGGRGGDDGGRGGSRTAPTANAPTAPDAPTVNAPTANAPTVNAPTTPAKRKTVGRLVGAFKTVSTKRINDQRGTPGAQVWQRDFYEHISAMQRRWREFADISLRIWPAGRAIQRTASGRRCGGNRPGCNAEGVHG